MESESTFPVDAVEGAEVQASAENQAAESSAEASSAVLGNDLEDIVKIENEAAGNGAAPTSSSDGVDAGSHLAEESAMDEEDLGNAEAEAEAMDIDDTAGVSHPEESSYIGDNCLSTPAETEDNSPEDDSEALVDQIKEEDQSFDESLEVKEELPDQSISSAGIGDGTPIVQDDESSTMDEDMGGGEGVASSDDVNDISSAATEAISTGISSSTAEGGADISSSGQSEPTLISSTANGPALLHSFSSPQAELPEESGAADTSEPAEGEAEAPDGGEGAGGPPAAVTSSAEEGAVSSSGAAPLPPTDAAHALATLASAALHHHEQAEPEEAKSPINDEDVWYTVGIVTGTTTFTVQNYISNPNLDLSALSLDNLPDLSCLATTPLEHGTAYKFRVAAVNSCGRGDFSEESAFKTCLPGFPGAPSAIKISKSAEGAHLSWEPPQVAAEGIFEYSVYLAVRSNTQPKETSKSQLAFVRVYCGKANTCVVPQSSLSAAHVDSSTKPAIIFRIAARNDKGYGPATQVRWLQDIKSTGVKRSAGDGRLPGASPSKQTKQILQ